MDAAVAGLIGAAIGSSSSLITVWIQARYTAKRERAKFAVEFAEKDRRDSREYAITMGNRGAIPPVALYAHYHSEMLKLLESGKMNPKSMEKLTVDNRELWAALRRLHGDRSDDRYPDPRQGPVPPSQQRADDESFFQ